MTKRMEVEEFSRCAKWLFGTEEHKCANMALLLGIRASTVRQWVPHNDFPDWAADRIRLFVSEPWIIGKGMSSGSRCLTHNLYPRFTIFLSDGSNDITRTPITRLNISWIDERPASDEQLKRVLAQGQIFLNGQALLNSQLV